MMKSIKLLLPLGTLTFASGLAAQILTTDFNSATAGTINEASLNAVTTGGTWSFNFGRGATFDLESDVGSATPQGNAFTMDDSGTLGSSELFASVTLDSAFDLSGGNTITFDFDVQNKRTGTVKSTIIQFRNSSGDIASQITWTDDTTDTVDLNGSTTNFSWSNINANYNSDTSIESVTIALSDSGVDLDFGSANLSSTIQNGATEIAEIRFLSGGSSTSAKGFRIDNLSAIPEPSNYALIGGLLALTSVMARRRK